MQDLQELKNLALAAKQRGSMEDVQACQFIATIAVAERLDEILEEMKGFNKPTGANIPLARVWDNEEDDVFNTWTNA